MSSLIVHIIGAGFIYFIITVIWILKIMVDNTEDPSQFDGDKIMNIIVREKVFMHSFFITVLLALIIETITK
jgi:hypothetical protein